MDVSEDKEHKSIVGAFTKGVDFVRKRKYREALEVFENILKDHKDSTFYSVVEVETRSKAYKKICESQLNPVKIELNSNEDYLYDGLFHLNSGKIDLAFERFKYLEEKHFGDPYLSFLLSIVYLKKEEKDNCLNYLKTAIEKDSAYKIIAHNEPDFDPLFDDPSFVQLVEQKIEN
jgi:tetratricopeptide (TPR) repeat protein